MTKTKNKYLILFSNGIIRYINILLQILAFCYSNHINAQEFIKENKPEFEGKVKSVIESKYEVTTDSGGVLKRKKISLDGRYGYEKEFFNRKGLLIKRITYKLDDSTALVENYSYKNNNRRKTEIRRDGNHKLVCKIISTYDKYGNCTSEINYEPDGEIFWQTTYENKYDSDGRFATVLEYDRNDSLKFKRSYMYQIREDKYFEIIEEIEYGKSKTVSGLVYEYSINNKELPLRYIIFNSKGFPISSRSYSYNENNDIIEYVDYLQRKYTMKNKYDENGNWIIREISVNGQFRYIEERIIKYY